MKHVMFLVCTCSLFWRLLFESGLDRLFFRLRQVNFGHLGTLWVSLNLVSSG